MPANFGPANERLNEPCLETGDELVTCPYDPSHRLRPTRYHLHLKKCAVQHPEKQYHICNLNFTHHVPPEKIKEHMRSCPDRHKVDSFIYTTENVRRQVSAPVVVEEPAESWDDEDCPTYDPMKANENNPVLLCLKGASRSERKNFQTQQRIRNSRLLNGDPPL
ncbi:gametocyte-specific factor 1-like [Ctenocephalides felis]|uniref:gametocyte-specific factor 1-like n=1 Tax=Ctenocephalides felis TaxID=7515 RepID=UPI000E6E3DAC|nr:gametocyte-specific factor 1-like [Ctenocephalides felis]